MLIEHLHEIRDLMRLTSELPASQRLIVLLYASYEGQAEDGTVEEPGAALAASIGITPQVFSRTRIQLVESGWLEETRRYSNVPFFRLTEKAYVPPREDNVVHLDRAS